MWQFEKSIKFHPAKVLKKMKERMKVGMEVLGMDPKWVLVGMQY